MPHNLRAEGPRHRFDEIKFRDFSNERRKEWEGAPVSVVPRDANVVRFAIFGDVAGSEFPFASKQSGYYAYKQIIKSISARQPDFAVSTGDLALRATHLAYRRLRKLLRYVTFPLIATPGNHDIVDRSVVHSQFFHGLFGSDHGDVTIGNVRLVLINNAWGSFEDDQLKWIDETFAKTSTAKSTLVFCHKPVFDPRENTYYGMEHRPHAEHLHALFVKHKVSAVFSGHIHSLLHTERDGVHYIISGGGGSKLKTAHDAHHYLWCEATEQGVHVTAHGLEKTEPMFDLNLSART
ncbi:MAG: metallophosphoesterase [bacterium]|nr:metallophosphoesterase [bacterium]